MQPVNELGAIFGITLLAHLVGSAVLAGVTGGPLMLLAAPLVAFFGWFMLIPELAIVALQWELLKRRTFSRTYRAWVVAVFVTSVVFTCFAPKEQGNFTQWSVGYALGSVLAFSISFAIIHSHHKTASKHPAD